MYNSSSAIPFESDLIEYMQNITFCDLHNKQSIIKALQLH